MSADRDERGADGSRNAGARFFLGLLTGVSAPVWVLAVLSKVEQFVGAIDFVDAVTAFVGWLNRTAPPVATVAEPVLTFVVGALAFIRGWYAAIFYPPLEWSLGLAGVRGSPELYDWIIFAVTFTIVTASLAGRAYETKLAHEMAAARRAEVGDDHHGPAGATIGIVLGTVLFPGVGTIVGGILGGYLGSQTPTEEAVVARQAEFDAGIAASAAGDALVRSTLSTLALAAVFTGAKFLFG